MEPSDTSPGAPALAPTWTALGHRLAATVGAGAALLALVRHVPVGTASLRGASAWLAILVVTRSARALLDRRPPPGPAVAPPERSAEEPNRT